MVHYLKLICPYQTRLHVFSRSSSFSGFLLGLTLLLTACSSGPTGTSPTPVLTPTAAVPTLSQAQLIYRGQIGSAVSVAWSPDGKSLASCGNDGTVQVWDATSGTPRWQIKIGAYTFAVAWSPDGQQVAGGTSDGSVYLLNAADGQQRASYHQQKAAIEGLAWSPDGTMLVAGSQDNTADVWNVQSGKLLLSYTGHSASVARVSWSPDGTKIASASYDGTVQIWDAHTGQHMLTYSDHKAPVWEVAWSPDGKRIVSGTGAADHHSPVTAHNSVKVWDATTGKTLLTYADNDDENQAYALAWSPDGTKIASAGNEPRVALWDAATGKTLLLYTGHHDMIFKLAWSPDGSLLASASVDDTIQLWQPHL